MPHSKCVTLPPPHCPSRPPGHLNPSLHLPCHIGPCKLSLACKFLNLFNREKEKKTQLCLYLFFHINPFLWQWMRPMKASLVGVGIGLLACGCIGSVLTLLSHPSKVAPEGVPLELLGHLLAAQFKSDYLAHALNTGYSRGLSHVRRHLPNRPLPYKKIQKCQTRLCKLWYILKVYT